MLHASVLSLCRCDAAWTCIWEYNSYTRAYTHTHTHIHLHICLCVHVCVCVCACVCLCLCVRACVCECMWMCFIFLSLFCLFLSTYFFNIILYAHTVFTHTYIYAHTNAPTRTHRHIYIMYFAIFIIKKCLLMARETGVQFQFESYQRLKKNGT